MTAEPTIRDVLDAIQLFATSVDQRFEQVDQRFIQVDQRFEQVDKRLSDIDGQLHDIRSTMATRQDIEQLVTKEYLEGRLAHIR